MDDCMNEKEAIEKATADEFIKLYNSEMKTSFWIIEHSDSPDIRCTDKSRNTLNFEITLTEDRPQDIQAPLGRSNHRSADSLKQHLEEVKTGKANPLERVSHLQGNVTEMLVSRIQSKLKKDYGSNVALVIRDSSPLDWAWDVVTDKIISQLNLDYNPFDKGIWLITYSKDRIYRLL
jgi:hypothetical protein